METLDQPIVFIATSDPEASRRFYEDIIGLAFLADEPFALVFDLGGTPLRVQKVASLEPAPFTALGWSVTDIETAMQGLRSRGVEFERFPQLPQDDEGIWEAPGGVKIAWFRDPDGNTLSLTQG